MRPPFPWRKERPSARPRPPPPPTASSASQPPSRYTSNAASISTSLGFGVRSCHRRHSTPTSARWGSARSTQPAARTPASLTSIGRAPPTRRTAPPTSASVPTPKITSGIRNLLTRPCERDRAGAAVSATGERLELTCCKARSSSRLPRCGQTDRSAPERRRTSVHPPAADRSVRDRTGARRRLRLVLGQPGAQLAAAGREPLGAGPGLLVHGVVVAAVTGCRHREGVLPRRQVGLQLGCDLCQLSLQSLSHAATN